MEYSDAEAAKRLYNAISDAIEAVEDLTAQNDATAETEPVGLLGPEELNEMRGYIRAKLAQNGLGIALWQMWEEAHSDPLDSLSATE